MNQAIEANIVRPELPEEADRVEQLLVNFSFSVKKDNISFSFHKLALFLSSAHAWSNCPRLSSAQCSKGSTTSTRRWRSGLDYQDCHNYNNHLFEDNLIKMITRHGLALLSKQLLRISDISTFSPTPVTSWPLTSVTAGMSWCDSHILTNNGDNMTFDFGDSRYVLVS